MAESTVGAALLATAVCADAKLLVVVVISTRAAAIQICFIRVRFFFMFSILSPS
jgi:hypothetical protein